MKRVSLSLAGIALAAIMAIGLYSRLTTANDIAHYQTFFDTDVATDGYGGMRDIGTGTITLSGVSGTVTTALLYWHGPTDSTDPDANATVTFAGQEITGANIGFSSDNYWDYDNSQAYRADVTSLVTGNGDYALADFTKADANVNGASLIVFFDDGNDTNNRDVVVFDGNDSTYTNVYDANGWNVSLSGIDYTSGSASIELHVSDGQVFEPLNDGALILNGGTVLEPAGAIFDGDSVPNGPSAEDTGGGLWDIKSYTVTGELTPGLNTLTLTSAHSYDCLSLIVALVDLPAGAAPTEEPTVAPTVRHRRSTATATATAAPTATPLPPSPTIQPLPPSPTASVGVQITVPRTGDGPETDASPGWLPAACLLVAMSGAVGLAGGLVRFKKSERAK
jgi:hypothetical protein